MTTKPKVGKARVHGEDIIILEVDRYGGYISIPVAKLEKKMSDLFAESELDGLATEMGKPLSAVRNMTFKNAIKEDIKGKNRMGWKRHQKVLKGQGYDV